MPTYLDIHDIPGVRADAVAGAHEADVRVQRPYGVEYRHYWVDEEAGRSSASSTRPIARPRPACIARPTASRRTRCTR